MEHKYEASYWRIGIVIVAICGLSVIAATRSGTSGTTELTVRDSGAAAAAAADDQARDAKVALISIRSTGFEPRELALTAGKYLLVVRNRSSADEFAIRVQRETGETLHELRAGLRGRDAKQFLQLTPGEYVLQETSHPDWTCRITVSSH